VAPEVGAVVQRLARVTLENVRTHSNATQVRALIDFGLQNLTVLIEDDGQGFDPELVDLQGKNRIGLAGVAERARVVGGSLRVESAPAHGTRVYAELPYTPGRPTQAVEVPSYLPASGFAPFEPVASAVPAEPGTAIRVLLIDDHPMVREGLVRMLQDQPDLEVIGAEANGTDGLRRIADLQPDVVLCDMQLPDMSGVEVIAKASTHFPEVRCLVVTTYDSDDFIYEGIKAGAKGYVLKDVSAEELVNAVRAAGRGESLLQPIVARKLVDRFADLARQGGMVEALTEREVEVLQALAGGARNKEIAFSLSLSESTIKTHLASIFGKLGVTTRTEAVSRGRELGLIAL
jgi:DNA-binding NarL/FixJ family response regulator